MTKQRLFSVTIADYRVNTFRVGGKGGQHQNMTNSGVRVVHEPSGAVGECRESPSQHRNKRAAFGRMARSPAFTRWARIEVKRLTGEKSIEEKIAEDLSPQNLRVGSGGEWVFINGMSETAFEEPTAKGKR